MPNASPSSTFAFAALALAVAACVLSATPAEAKLFIPGVTPQSYLVGQPLAIKVNSLTSVTRVMPMNWYSLPWCQVSKEDRKKYRKSQNLGEILWGNRVEPSLYQAEMLNNATCRKVCPTMKLNKKDQELLTKRVEENYRGHLVLDSLPVAEEGSGKLSRLSPSVATGFPLGVSKKATGNGKTIIHNHLAFTIQYHEHHPPGYIPTMDDEGSDSYRIVGFMVTPVSVDHDKAACDDSFKITDDVPPVFTDADEITWTYSINWQESDIEWSTRWDVYMRSSKAESRIHWLSIINSLLIVLLLTTIIAFILIRLLRRDFARYNDPEAIQEDREDTGWKLVHGDVFRKPQAAGLLAVLVGSGMQLLGMCVCTLGFASLGFLSPANRGSLLTALIFLYVLLGSHSGYTTARFAQFFKLKSWKIIFATGLFFPGTMFTCYILLNFIHWGNSAASATPFLTILTVVALWTCVSLPLVLLGGAIGFRRDVMEVPLKVNAIERTIPPQPWYLQYPLAAIVPGILPFGSAFIESVFILSSVWQGRVYYVFGFLALVFAILIITCAEATIVVTYFQLVNLDYRWWWKSFFTSGSYAVWLFAYSIFYYATALTIRSWWSSVLYFGYMFMVSWFFFVMTGTIGFIAAFAFVRRIYGSIKVD